MTIAQLIDMLSPNETELFTNLDSPQAIQAFLDSIPYSSEHRNRSPLSVLRDRVAHCLDGGLFAAAALRRLEEPAIVIDLQTDPGVDDDHVLAIYRRDGYYGALAKSNFSGLRFREAIHRSLRELVMTYFEPYFSANYQKTLRYYTYPLNLQTCDHLNWLWNDEAASQIEQILFNRRRVTLLTQQMIDRLSPVDERAYQAGMLGVNPDGLFQPHE